MTPRQGLGIAFGVVAMILWIMAGGYLCNEGDGERATGIIMAGVVSAICCAASLAS